MGSIRWDAGLKRRSEMPQTRSELERISRSQTSEVRLVRRANMVLGCLDGKRIIDIAAGLDEQEDVIIKNVNKASPSLLFPYSQDIEP